ncbi:uncharacterized protein PHALS_09810 [Plasmopara halstedii]|uniref:Uncharacterized protein n=1 Tax=Plasmopara halstedii TaxID=4781 RepID=A0A0P1AF89_PLAHL|nr:uncharacterized protein PHALS_09810 [Plasmopara halstedii]CEG39570.1 hypothetical protein PHALS_09810 [Plasmopara halstedii]|eukprot:XP_024575939.1 hypothetical protein PHALS_09810 [Plasmopara halstedii]
MTLKGIQHTLLQNILEDFDNILELTLTTIRNSLNSFKSSPLQLQQFDILENPNANYKGET